MLGVTQLPEGTLPTFTHKAGAFFFFFLILFYF